jgi:hypothetical protein
VVDCVDVKPKQQRTASQRMSSIDQKSLGGYMAHYSTLRGNELSSSSSGDVRGAKVYGRNDKGLGKIDDVIFDHTSGKVTYVVIDTGGWLTTKKFLVPANQVSDSAQHSGDFVVDLTKEQIERFPAYDETDLESEEKWSVYEGKYRDSWSEGSVLHREGSNRTVTPPTTETIASRERSTPADAEQEEADLAAAEAPTDRVFPAGGNEWERNPVAGAVGSRWEGFQESLRQRRKEVIGTCERCGKSADTETKSEDRRRTGT